MIEIKTCIEFNLALFWFYCQLLTIKKNNMTHKTLAQILNQSSPSTESSLGFIRLIKEWPRIIDNDFIASNSTPMKFHQQTLTIMTSHPTISHDLKNRFLEIKTKIGQYFPLIARDMEKIAFYSNSHFFLNKDKASSNPKNEQKQHLHAYNPKVQEIKNSLIKDWPELKTDQELLNSFVSLQWQISLSQKA